MIRAKIRPEGSAVIDAGEDLAAIVRIGPGGVEAAASPARLRAARAALRRDETVRLPSILDEKLLENVRARMARAEFSDLRKSYDTRGTPVDKSLNAFLAILFSDQRLFRLVESLSGCARIERLAGSVFRTEPGSRHLLRWHDDLGGAEATRVMAMSVNLGREPVQGGAFQIRRRGERRLLAEVPYDRGGDAVLFRVSPELRHRSTRVAGKAVKTIFACWFHAAAPS